MELKSAKELKELVKGLFENATDKAQIDAYAKINAAVDAVDKEGSELIAQNAELSKGYRDLMKHTSFTDEPKTTETQPSGTAPDLNALLKNFLAEHPENK